MMIRRVFVAFWFLIFLLPQAIAGTMAAEAIDIIRIVQQNPRAASADAQLLLQQANAKGNKSLELRALRILAYAHSLLGSMFVLGEDISRGEQLARELNNPQAWIEFVIARANEAQLAGQFAKADKRYAEALSMAQKSRLSLGIALSYAAIVNASLDRGLKNNVVVYATKAYDLFENQGDVRGMAQMLVALGIHSGDLARSIEYLERAVDIYDPSIYRWDSALAEYHLGDAYYRNKDYANARVYLQKALAETAKLAIPLNTAYIEYRLGRIELGQRRFAEALVHWNRAIPIFLQNKDLSAVFETQRFRADALSALGRKNESLAALSQSQSAADSVRLLESKGKTIQRISWLQTPFDDSQLAYQEMIGNLYQKRTDLPAQASASVAQARFDTKLKEAENALLKEQQRRAELERITLVLALTGSVAILLLAIFLLFRQVKQKRQFANLALRDELTGLRNRRSILEFGRVQFETRLKLGTKLFIAILDLDHFKLVNDQYGHDVGDAVLIAFANACQRHLRSNHVFGRFGGEEFLLIMPDTREDQIFDIFERLREVVSEVAVPGLPASHRLSFSMGSAEVRPEIVTLEALIKEADKALYKAKEKGRDRCEIALGGLQATYDTNVQRARPTGHGPLAYEPPASLLLPRQPDGTSLERPRRSN
jgi:diguanylate cyclase (GGDEF)-like protein